MRIPVYYNGQIVGEGEIKTEGLYYHIICTCIFKKVNLYRVFLKSCNRIISIGVCVPVENVFVARKKIPRKGVEMNDVYLYAIGDNQQNRFVEINEKDPFPYIDQLESCRLVHDRDDCYRIFL